jgi:hypothetical protein
MNPPMRPFAYAQSELGFTESSRSGTGSEGEPLTVPSILKYWSQQITSANRNGAPGKEKSGTQAD